MDEHWLTRSEWLVGTDGLDKLKKSTVLVAGLGGVGSYAAEMLARAGVGHLILIDNDKVTLTNRNRQLPALVSTEGLMKTQVMAARLRDINPVIGLTLIEEYLDEQSVPRLLEGFMPSYVVDAIDTLSPKIALICYCMEHSLPLVSAMGAGAKMDATQVRVGDISKSFNCPLAFMLRKRLRKLGVRKGFKVVFSQELPDPGAVIPCDDRNKKSQVGTISYLPAVFGCVCAQTAIRDIIDFCIFENSLNELI
ncbi:MAG: tRNA threonylcarbamoyladenosine dehydratase [Bacteroidales bacterium]|nr:tRNA threonylcarbamoyladenosine dehydratase [Bacteroidales bacterium]